MKYIFYLIVLLFTKTLAGQELVDTAIVPQHPVVKKVLPHLPKKDSAVHRIAIDSTQKKKDTAITASRQPTPFKADKYPLLYREVLKINPWFNFFGSPENFVSEDRVFTGQEPLFYIMAGLLLFFALVKLLFNRYVNNLLGLVFRGSLRQKQIREQLLQTPLPSLFLNIFFAMVAGLYIFSLLGHYKIVSGTAFWLLLLYCVLAVGLLYLGKFLMLKFTGWIFNMRDAADTYIFIVFLVNKLLAIFLLPLIIIMTFSFASWSDVLITLSYILIIVFFAYRYIVSFAPVRREVKVSQFHFFMYLCAFEIIPLLLIYKVLLTFF